MTPLTDLFSLPLAERIGWTLVHFLWQGALAAGVLLVMQRLLLRASAEMRYAAACLTLALMAASPPATFLSLPRPESEESPSGRIQTSPAMTPAAGISMSESPRASVVGVPPAIAPSAALSPHNATSAAAPTASEPSRSWRLAIGRRLRFCIPWVTAAWLVGVLFLSLRLLASWRSVQRMRRAGTSDVGEHLAILLREISEQLGVRRVVQLLESTVAEVPAAVGWFRPVILLPVSAVTGLSETQLKAILAHELAHIRRHDYLVNLAQSIVETLLFYHPAVWWASARIRQEREHCCDDLAGAVCGNRIDYARALLRMEELRGPSGNFVLAASGGRLTLRIRRLLGVPPRDHGGAWWLGGAMTLIVATTIISGLWWTSTLAADAPRQNAQPAQEDHATVADDQAGSWRVRLRAIDGASGRPIPNARFAVRLGKAEMVWRSSENGEFVAELPSRVPDFCELHCRADGCASARARWRNSPNARSEELPAEFTFPMSKAVSVGGVVLNDASEPVPGATVTFLASNHVSHLGWGVEHYANEEVVTNENGRWECRGVPARITSSSIRADHPDYAKFGYSWGLESRLHSLRDKSLALYLHTAHTLRGRVTGPDGKPLSGALLMQPGHPELFYEADAAGCFAIPRATLNWVAAVKPGFAPVLQEVAGMPAWTVFKPIEIPGEPGELAVSLERAAEVTFKVIDAGGVPVRGARVIPRVRHASDLAPDNLFDRLLGKSSPRSETDENGIWTWNSAPRGAEVDYDVLGAGYMAIRNYRRAVVKDAVFEIQLKRPQIVRGRVVDAETKRPIEKFFVRSGWSSGQWEGSVGTLGRDGQYEKPMPEPSPTGAYRYLAAADGYKPAESESVKHEEGETAVNFELKRKASETEQAPVAKSQEAPAEALLTVNVCGEPTNEPMKRFLVVPGFADGGYGSDPIGGPGEADEKTPAVWQPQRMRQCTDGLFTWPATRPGKELRFRIEADGYIPVLTAWIKKSDGKQTLNIAMRRDPGLTGKVLTPNGAPAAGAILAVTMRNRPARIENGEFAGLDDPPPATANERWKRPIFATADADGRYRLGTQVGTVIVYAVHDSGIAELPFNALQKSPDIRLQAWASIEGRVLWVDNPGANEDLALSTVRTFAGVFRSLEWKTLVKTNDQGRFRAGRLPPWSATLSRRFKLPNGWGDYLYPTLPVELKPGESTDVVFGGRGRPVVGKLVGFSSWEGTTVELYPRTYGRYDQFGRTMVSQSNLGPLLFRTGIPAAEDGTFRIENVLPAHYTLLVNNRERGFYAWQEDNNLSIDPMPGGESDDPFDMGEVRVKQHGTGKPADPFSSTSLPQR